MFHCEQNTGYAIESLEDTFLKAAINAGYSVESIHWSYSKILFVFPRTYEITYGNKFVAKYLEAIINEFGIETILAFDLPFPSKLAFVAKTAGVKNIISYLGASMSSLNRGSKLWIKKAEWFLMRRQSSDFFIFESKAMQKTATHGRGIPERNNASIHLGVVLEKFCPSESSFCALEEFGISKQKKIIFYSVHMEERKGVKVIVDSAITLFKHNGDLDIHYLICGNKGNEADKYLEQLVGTKAAPHVTFGGYRTDMPKLLRSSHIGVIASTGWDSFTMSCIEMLASGLPLIASDLQGLKETIDPGKCGEYIKPGDSTGLAKVILRYSQNPDRYSEHSEFARQRAIKYFSKSAQVQRISKHLIHSNSSKKVTSVTDGIKSNSASEDN
jgi:glycosyltransferase involved in cell wall biosynthesis